MFVVVDCRTSMSRDVSWPFFLVGFTSLKAAKVKPLCEQFGSHFVHLVYP